MAIRFFTENLAVSVLKRKETAAWIKNVIVKESKLLGDINYIFCSDEYLLEINQRYLQHDYYTDIISFDYSIDNIISGDLYISWERIKDNASSLGLVLRDEFHRVCVHGVLHLCGYKDKLPNDEILMRSKEDFYLNLR